jgi:flagellar basal-body rod protein FlgG
VLRQQVIANNLANQSTVAFKRRRAVLGDVAPREILPGGVLDAAGQSTAIGVEIGQGCQVLGTQADFRQGTLVRTGRSLDLAIDGPGFFQVADSDGTVLYTRAGALSINAIGSLVVGSALTGRLLEPTIVIPQNALDVVIKPSGRVQVRMPGQALRSDIGQIQLAFFLNCEGLRPVGENLFAQTDACGPPTTDNPGYNGLGKLRQHTLEQSNVDVGDERQEFADCTRQMRQLRRLLNLVGWKEESAVSGEGVNSD